MATSSNKVSKVRLELHASKLKNVAGAFKGTSDPYAVVTLLANDPREKPQVLGKTEVIKNFLNPRWTTSFDLNYEIGKLTRINVGIYDEIRKSANKPMGSALFELGEVLGARGNTKAKKLRNGGTLFARVTAAPVQKSGILYLSMRGVHLKNLEGLFGKSDPFFEICAKVQSSGGLTWTPVYRSKHVDNNLNPKWEPCSIDLDRVCDGDLNKPILISVWDWQKSGRHQTMGAFETSVQGLMEAQARGGTGDVRSVDTSRAFVLTRKGREYGKVVVTTAKVDRAMGGVQPTSGTMEPMQARPMVPPAVSSTSIPAFSQALNVPPPSFASAATAVSAAKMMSSAASTPYVPEPYAPAMDLPLPPPMAPPALRPTFVDYLSGGCELELCIAIDFTGSNGDPRRPGTLHYIHPNGQLNDYEKAITAVGSVIARYDSDQRFPVWGFGAKYGGVIQHCFQVGKEPLLSGISGVLEGYRSVFRTGLTMSGPTVFAEVIGLAAAMARSSQESAQRVGKQSYKILLILTDGAVSDMERTKQAVVNASDAPLSIVIVGIGNADFSAMQFLDDFQVNNSGNGRDICQFVEFSKYRDDKAALTRKTLEEIPDQLVDYFFAKGIKPLPPVSGSQLSLAISEPDEEDIDLNVQLNEEGEISLVDYNGAVYDDSKYDTMANYTSSPYSPTAPSAHQSAPYQPSFAPHAAPVQHQVYQPAASAPSQYGIASSVPHREPYVPNGNPSLVPYKTQQAPPVAVSATRVFHVLVPAGVAPGMQLRVENPVTGQAMIVTVPQGVVAGGKFAVQY